MEYTIFQVKRENPDFRMFMNSSWHASHGVKISVSAYDCIYKGKLPDGQNANAVLETLWERFNISHPADFKGHSLSVSDVVVLTSNGTSDAYFCDSVGWTPVPGFFET